MSNIKQDSDALRKEYIARAGKKLEFILTLAVLFPSLMYTFQKFSDASEQDASKAFLRWVIYIGVYILNYLLFDLTYKSASLRIIKVVHSLLLLAVVFYIFPVVTIAGATSNHEGAMDSLNKLLFAGSLVGMVLLPFVLLLTLSITPVRNFIRWVKTNNVRG